MSAVLSTFYTKDFLLDKRPIILVAANLKKLSIKPYYLPINKVYIKNNFGVFLLSFLLKMCENRRL